MDPQKGSVVFEGREIQKMDPDKVMRLGIGHVPEGRETFPFLTARENLAMGAYIRHDAAGIARDMEMVYGYFPRLKEREGQPAGSMSGGEQQMRSEEHTSELQSLMRISYAVFCLKKKKTQNDN